MEQGQGQEDERSDVRDQVAEHEREQRGLDADTSIGSLRASRSKPIPDSPLISFSPKERAEATRVEASASENTEPNKYAAYSAEKTVRQTETDDPFKTRDKLTHSPIH